MIFKGAPLSLSGRITSMEVQVSGSVLQSAENIKLNKK